jgi:hypothetical protein
MFAPSGHHRFAPRRADRLLCALAMLALVALVFLYALCRSARAFQIKAFPECVPYGFARLNAVLRHARECPTRHRHISQFRAVVTDADFGSATFAASCSSSRIMRIVLSDAFANKIVGGRAHYSGALNGENLHRHSLI